nr:putative reverse transcriptase domain-containing protein [Tanacetum cinerariifolium]
MLKVSPWKGVVRFGKRGKLNPRYVGPFKVLERVGDVAYKLNLPKELSIVHNTVHVSNLKKCHTDEPLAVPLDGLHFDDKFHFVKDLVAILDNHVFHTAQQAKLDLELVPREKNLDIRKCNRRLDPGKIEREPTFQVVLDALALTICYSTFLITADVLEVYMHQF